MLMLPSDGNAAEEMPELGGRKFGVPPDPADVGPRNVGDFADIEAVRNERY